MNSFEWVKQLRYYWDPDLDNCVVRMSNSLYIYGYEYLGASARLVITPLTVSIFACKVNSPKHARSSPINLSLSSLANTGHMAW